MTKKINKKIQNIILDENVLEKLNNVLESQIINSNVLVFVDFRSIAQFQNKLDEIKACSLNNLHITVAKNNDCFQKSASILDETFGFVLGIGESSFLEKVASFAIKNNINYAFVDLFLPKTQLFLHKNEDFSYFPPNFVMIEKKILNKSQQFEMLCDIFSYYYLLLESEIEFENNNLNEFSKSYKMVLNKVVKTFFDKNESPQNISKILFDCVISVGILLKKFKLTTFLSNFCCSFKNFVSNFIILTAYKNVFELINENNLCLTRANFLSSVQIQNFKNFDVKFNRIFLLNFKNKFYKKSQKNLEIITKLLE
ncbi:MAG: hypothetical protein ACI4TI_00700, partial [Christensenellales bacterium]